jgi:transposase-like protein
MNLTQVTSADLKQIAKLLEQKETLQAQIASIDSELGRFDAGQPAVPAKGKPGRKPARAAKAKPAKVKRAARGSVKAAIIELVKGAGESGITVKDIAAKLGTGYNRVFTWFYNTGSQIKAIKKAGPGRYAWVEGAARVIRPSPAPKPTPQPQPRPTIPPKASAKQGVAAKSKAGKPGVSKDRVIELLKGAGSAGTTVKELAAKLGVKAQRMYVWFGVTGKTLKEIKKIAPAKYAWVG